MTKFGCRAFTLAERKLFHRLLAPRETGTIFGEQPIRGEARWELSKFWGLLPSVSLLSWLASLPDRVCDRPRHVVRLY